MLDLSKIIAQGNANIMINTQKIKLLIEGNVNGNL